jgi:hypothetical protein
VRRLATSGQHASTNPSLPDSLRHLPTDHPIYGVSDSLLAEFQTAQEELLEPSGSAAEFCTEACQELGYPPDSAIAFDGRTLNEINDLSRAELVATMQEKEPGIEPGFHTAIAEQMQLRRAFADPESAIQAVEDKIESVVGDFPTQASDIEQGRNPGDLLDPFIVSAAQELAYRGSASDALEAITSHKILMVIEGLIGHLHEDVISQMRGNVRAPEPRGEELDFIANPFPGADIVQPPWSDERSLTFHQVKSKTGSAKGGDAARLGRQLRLLLDTYGGNAFYDALVGRSLLGHRSKGGVLRACPEAVVLVGQAAFEALTGSKAGAELLLRVYQEAFRRVAEKTGYSLTEVVARITSEFESRADQDEGEDFLEVLLGDVTTAENPDDQSSLTYSPRRRRQS